MNKFEELGIGKGLLETLKKLRFEEPTPIQEKAIPLVLKGKDVIGQAATGSGKTLAFGSGIITRLQKGKGVQALVLTPTRELAEQVSGELKKFAAGYDLEITEVYGGVSIEPQVRRIETADVVVGTPGRIIDHLTRRTLNLQNVRILVLDEADRMVDMGFLPDVEKIISSCSKRRQTLLFSATMSPDIDHVSKKYMIHPKIVSVESYVDPSKLKQIFYDVQQHEKFSLFLHLIKKDTSHISMVFCNTRGNVESVIKNLEKFRVNAVGIHGGMNQSKRNNVMEQFYKKHAHVLVCTDVAARGLDIKGVTHVYNYDVPKDSTDYIHRIGRTARAGKEGDAITLVCQKDYMAFRKVLDDPSIKIERQETPEFKRMRVDFRGYGEGGERGKRNYGRESRPVGGRGERRRGDEGGRGRGDGFGRRGGGFRRRGDEGGRGRGDDRRRRFDERRFGGDKGKFGGRDERGRGQSGRRFSNDGRGGERGGFGGRGNRRYGKFGTGGPRRSGEHRGRFDKGRKFSKKRFRER